MTVVSPGFFQDIRSFISNHKKLCAMTLGVAIVGYAVFSLGKRSIAWIISSRGTTERVSRYAENRLSTSLPKKNPIIMPPHQDDNAPSPSTAVIKQPPLTIPLPLSHTLREQIKKPPHFFSSTHPSGNKKGVGQAMTEYVQQQIESLMNFLQQEIEAPAEAAPDLAYLCIGAGQETSQIWPGFLAQAILDNNRIQLTCFEMIGGEYQPLFAIRDGIDTYKRYHQAHHLGQLPSNESTQHFSNRLNDQTSFHQFFCGFPDKDIRVNAEQHQLMLHDQLYCLQYCWLSQEKIDKVRELIERYIEKLLVLGKRVVLGSHAGRPFSRYEEKESHPFSLLIDLYEQFVSRYPGQIFYFSGHEGLNLLTGQPFSLTETDKIDICVTRQPHDFATQHPEWKYSADLAHCMLP